MEARALCVFYPVTFFLRNALFMYTGKKFGTARAAPHSEPTLISDAQSLSFKVKYAHWLTPSLF